jgi:hypothetical protein
MRRVASRSPEAKPRQSVLIGELGGGNDSADSADYWCFRTLSGLREIF